MANYQESQVSGSTYTRCNQVVITNPLNGVPQVQFYEESVAVLGTDTLRNARGAIQTPFNPNCTIAMVDPSTMQPFTQEALQALAADLATGTPKQSTAYILLFGMYLQTAAQRDAGSAQVMSL